MDGLVKVILVLIGIGMLIYFLGARAFDRDPATLQPTDLTDPGGEDDSCTEDEKEELKTLQEEIDRQMADIETEEKKILADRAALDQEIMDLDLDRQDLQEAQALLSSQALELDQAWAKLEAEKAELSQYRQKLLEKEQSLEAEQDRLTMEANRIQETYTVIQRIEKNYFLIIGLVVVLSLGFNACAFLYYRRKNYQAVRSRETVTDLLLAKPEYRRYIIQQARQREIDNNILRLNGKQQAVHPESYPAMPDKGQLTRINSYTYTRR